MLIFMEYSVSFSFVWFSSILNQDTFFFAHSMYDGSVSWISFTVFPLYFPKFNFESSL